MMKRIMIFWMATMALLFSAGANSGANDDAHLMQERIRAYCGSNTNDTRMLEIVYFHPSDTEPHAGYQERIQRIMLDIQSFYRDEMNRNGYGETVFPLDMVDGKLKIHVVKGKKSSAEYDYQSGETARQEIQQALGNQLQMKKAFVLIFYGLSDRQEDGSFLVHSPYYGDGGSCQSYGLCHAADCELLDPQFFTEKKRYLKYTEHSGTFTQFLGDFNTKYIGGTAHELGHGLGLPHNGQTQAERQKRGNALMGAGSLTYRNDLRGGKGSFLTFASATRLASHPLFTRSDARNAQAGRCEWRDLAFSTDQKDLVVEGRIKAQPEAYAMIAYMDPEGGNDYDSLTTVVPVHDGKFRLQVKCPTPGPKKFKLVACHLNGSTSKESLNFMVKPDIYGLTDQWQLKMVSDRFVSGRTAEAAQLAQAALDTKTLSAIVIRKLQHLITLCQVQEPPISPSAVEEKEANLSDLQWSSAKLGWGPPLRNRYFVTKSDANLLFLELGDTFYEKGLYAHAPSQYTYNLDGRFNRFTATVGLQKNTIDLGGGSVIFTKDKQVKKGVTDFGSAIFKVRGDGRTLFKSNLLKKNQIEKIDIDITGIKKLELIVVTGKEDNSYCWSIWAEPKIYQR